jgi:hypothetical protein
MALLLGAACLAGLLMQVDPADNIYHLRPITLIDLRSASSLMCWTSANFL